MRVAVKNEFAVTVIWVALTLLGEIISLPGLIQLLLALPFILLLPGYSLLAWLAPAKDSLSGWQRLGISMAMGVVLFPVLIGIPFQFSPWGITPLSVSVALSALIIAMAGGAWYRRKKLPPEKRFLVEVTLPKIWGRGMRGADLALNSALVVAVLVAVTSAAYAALSPSQGDKDTEFYLAGMQGYAEAPPIDMRMDDTRDLAVGVINQEGEPVEYWIEASLEGTDAQQRVYVKLEDNQETQAKVPFLASRAGKNQKLEVRLYRGSGSQPYRLLYLTANVYDVDEAFSSLYFTGYPDLRDIHIGEPIVSRIKVENHESRRVLYHIFYRASWTPEAFDEIASFVLDDGQSWEQDVTIPGVTRTYAERVEYHLSRDFERITYKQIAIQFRGNP